MNLVIERSPALSALKRLADVVDRKSTIPIFSNVALTAEGSTLSLRATNGDMEAIETISAEVTADGAITLPVDKLRDIVSNTDAGAQISLSVGDSAMRATVKSGRSKFNLAGLPAADFPTFKAGDFFGEFSVPCKVLADMIARVAWSVDKGQTYSISSVYLHVRDGELRTVAACNSSGIALRKEAGADYADPKAMLPPRLVVNLLRWLADGEGDVSISRSDSAYENDGPPKLIRFQRPGSTLTASLFDSSAYPDYHRAIPGTLQRTATTDQDALKLAISRALIMSEDHLRAVTLTFSPGDLGVMVRGGQVGEGEDNLSADYDGPEVKFSIAAGPLVSALGAMKGDRVEFSFNDANDDANAKLTVRAPADPAFDCVLMKLFG